MEPEATKTKEREKGGKVIDEDRTPIDPPPRPSKGCGGAECEVSFSRGVTLNLGDREFMRITIGLKMPAPKNPAAIERAFEVTRKWVDAKLEAEADAAPK